MPISVESKPLIAVTGTGPGSGASTLCEKLASEFNISWVSAGKVRRALTLAWINHAQTYGNNQETWNNFQSSLSNNPQLLTTTLERHQHTQTEEGQLAEFDLNQKNYDPDNKFELLPDLHMIHHILEYQSGVLDGKLAILIDKIKPTLSLISDERYFEQLKSLSLPILRILLQVTPRISAERILSREKSKRMAQNQSLPSESDDQQLAIIEQQVIDRTLGHWDRFNSTYIMVRSGLPVTPYDLYRVLPHVINTNSLSPDQVHIEATEFCATQLSSTP